MKIHFLFFVIFAIVKFITWICTMADTQRRKNKARNRAIRREQSQNRSDLHSRSQARSTVGREEDSFQLDRDGSVWISRDERIAKVVRALRGELTQDGSFSVISFKRKDYRYKLFLKRNHGAYSIRVTSGWPDPKFRMRVFPQDKNGMLEKKFFGIDDIEIGNSKFDREFIIQSNSTTELKKILDKKVCKLIRTHRKFAHKRIEIRINGNHVEIGGMANEILAHEQIIAITKNFAEIHRLMMINVTASGGMELVFVERKQSKCMVCGQLVGDEGVNCRSCETRYHRDCWEYIGKCSTYGCRSRKYH